MALSDLKLTRFLQVLGSENFEDMAMHIYDEFADGRQNFRMWVFSAARQPYTVEFTYEDITDPRSLRGKIAHAHGISDFRFFYLDIGETYLLTGSHDGDFHCMVEPWMDYPGTTVLFLTQTIDDEGVSRVVASHVMAWLTAPEAGDIHKCLCDKRGSTVTTRFSLKSPVGREVDLRRLVSGQVVIHTVPAFEPGSEEDEIIEQATQEGEDESVEGLPEELSDDSALIQHSHMLRKDYTQGNMDLRSGHLKTPHHETDIHEVAEAAEAPCQRDRWCADACNGNLVFACDRGWCRVEKGMKMLPHEIVMTHGMNMLQIHGMPEDQLEQQNTIVQHAPMFFTEWAKQIGCIDGQHLVVEVGQATGVCDVLIEVQTTTKHGQCEMYWKVCRVQQADQDIMDICMLVLEDFDTIEGQQFIEVAVNHDTCKAEETVNFNNADFLQIRVCGFECARPLQVMSPEHQQIDINLRQEHGTIFLDEDHLDSDRIDCICMTKPVNIKVVWISLAEKHGRLGLECRNAEKGMASVLVCVDVGNGRRAIGHKKMKRMSQWKDLCQLRGEATQCRFHLTGHEVEEEKGNITFHDGDVLFCTPLSSNPFSIVDFLQPDFVSRRQVKVDMPFGLDRDHDLRRLLDDSSRWSEGRWKGSNSMAKNQMVFPKSKGQAREDFLRWMD